MAGLVDFGYINGRATLGYEKRVHPYRDEKKNVPRKGMYKSCVLRSILSRIQLAPHARRKAVPITESGWIPALCVKDEVAKSRRTGITIAYTEE